ncbi:uncharacterized protein F5891DRAFT_163090 [Suillus fuscotomentosus]|uniref:F-box domain-containing protein n=1 Tax=Suillus fuscotomentosus TaxID=1912939 RepID=A0AAD4EA80_9AGAM|nr:uncharacterized protein F5891DRAFT_163090 [Suillus fuscotomentosus]KAG1902451.1 hypothetical protein F5891DRAFT_163090 [Suillus fuscotomentosus]
MDPMLLMNPSRTITYDQVPDMDANADCTEIYQVLPPTHIAEIPVEILSVIMEFTMPPTQHFLDSTVIARDNRSSRSCSLQTLRNIVLVSRYWYNVGISFLYRHVVILHSKQLFALAHAVSNNRSLSELILSLHLQCYVSVSQAVTVSMTLDDILAVTPNLTKVTIAPILNGRHFFLGHEFLRMVALAQNTPSRTTDLHFRVNPTLIETLNLLPAFTCLTTFHIDMFTGGNDALPTGHIHLAFLEELHITWQPHQHVMNVFSALAEIFSLPSLRRLLLTSPAAGGATIEPLLRKFGHSLHFVSLVRPHMTNVHLRFFYSPPPPPAPLVTPLLSMCPNLRHLAIDTHFPIRMPMHAHLTWVDLWVPIKFLDPSEQSAVTLVPHEERVKLPSLRGVRLLDRSLFPFSGVRTPLLIPPDMVGSTESVAWTYPSLDLRHDPGLLYRHMIDNVLAESLEHRL